MAQSINLIPQEERVEQRKEHIVKFSSVIAVFILVVVAGIAAYYFFTSNSLRNRIESQEKEIESYRTDISGLAEMEIAARTLDAKYTILKELFEARRKYSVLLTEFRKRVPPGVQVESFSIGGDTSEGINISGTADNYIAVARFVNTLSDTQLSSASTGLGDLFTDISLNSVVLNTGELNVNYAIVAGFNAEKLK